jgi:tetratricopeptide (TPR) repeat protein
MNTKRRMVAWILVVILMASGPAFAKREARLIGQVLDPDGNPVEGVTVTITSEQVPGGFNEVETTDKKGVFKVDFEEINVIYYYRFDKVGFQPMQTEHNWQKEGTERYKFTIYPGETPAVEGVEVTTTSNPAITAFNAGVAAFGDRSYQEAEKRFREAVELDPEFERAWGALAVALVEQGSYQDGVEAAEKAIALGSTHEMVLRARWNGYRGLGDEVKAAEAQDALEEAGRLAEDAKKTFNEGVQLYKQGDYEGAYAKYQQAFDMDKNLKVAQLGVATMGLKTERYREAIAAAEEMLKDEPSNNEAIRIRYNAALKLGDEQLLIDALVSLAAVEPEAAVNGLWALAMISYDANDSERAKDRFSKLLAISPGHARAHYYLGLLYVSDGVNDKAIAHLERFCQLAPEDPEAASATDLVTYLRENPS